MLMAASRTISSLGSNLKFAVEEHHQHVSPHQGPCPPPIYPTGRHRPFPQSPCAPWQAEESAKAACREMAPAPPTDNNSCLLPFLPNSSSEPGISCTVSHWSSQQLIKVSVIILILQKRHSERWNNLPRVTQPGSGSSAIRTKVFPVHPLCTLPSAGQVR